MARRSVKFDRKRVAEALREGRFEDISVEDRIALADFIEPKKRGPSLDFQENIDIRNNDMAELIKKLRAEGYKYEKIIEKVLKLEPFSKIQRKTVEKVITRLNKGDFTIDYVTLVSFANTINIVRNVIGDETFNGDMLFDNLLTTLEPSNHAATTVPDLNTKNNEIIDTEYINILKPRFGL